MAEHGKWTRKGATLSDVTAEAEYGVSRAFIVEDIKKGKLEFRDGAVWGNPCFRLLRSQVETSIREELGEAYLVNVRGQAELRRIKSDRNSLWTAFNYVANYAMLE